MIIVTINKIKWTRPCNYLARKKMWAFSPCGPYRFESHLNAGRCPTSYIMKMHPQIPLLWLSCKEVKVMQVVTHEWLYEKSIVSATNGLGFLIHCSHWVVGICHFHLYVKKYVISSILFSKALVFLQSNRWIKKIEL